MRTAWGEPGACAVFRARSYSTRLARSPGTAGYSPHGPAPRRGLEAARVAPGRVGELPERTVTFPRSLTATGILAPILAPYEHTRKRIVPPDRKSPRDPKRRGGRDRVEYVSEGLAWLEDQFDESEPPEEPSRASP